MSGGGTINLLLIDDQEERLKSEVAAFLTAMGYTLLHVSVSADPLTYFDEEAPELVLLSLGRPDALAVSDNLRNDPQGASLPLIFIGSAEHSVNSTALALSAGADYYFTYPVDLESLLSKITTYVGRAVKTDVEVSKTFQIVKPAPEFEVAGLLEESLVVSWSESLPESLPLEVSVEKEPETSVAPVSLVAPLGRSADFGVVKLFYQLWDEEFTGLVELGSSALGSVKYKVYFEDGVPLAVKGPLPLVHELLAYLTQAGFLTPAAAESVFNGPPLTFKQLGSWLLKAGYLKAAELPKVLREYLKTALFKLLSLKESTYEVKAGKLPVEIYDERIVLDLETPALLWRWSKRTYPRSPLLAAYFKYDLTRLSLPLYLVPERTLMTNSRLSLALNLEPLEQFLWSWLSERVEQEIAFKEVLTASALDPLSTYQILRLLELLGLVTVRLKSLPTLDFNEEYIQHKLACARQVDYLAILGIPPGAGDEQLLSAYYHNLQKLGLKDEILLIDLGAPTFLEIPDYLPRQLQPALAEIKEVLAEAYEVLLDPARGLAYVKNLPLS